MRVDEFPIKNGMKDHLSWSTEILCRVRCFAYDVCQCLQSNIALVHDYKINGIVQKNRGSVPQVIHTGKNTVWKMWVNIENWFDSEGKRL